MNVDAGHALLEDSAVICELQFAQDEAGRPTVLQTGCVLAAAAAAAAAEPVLMGTGVRTAQLRTSALPGLHALHRHPTGNGRCR